MNDRAGASLQVHSREGWVAGSDCRRLDGLDETWFILEIRIKQVTRGGHSEKTAWIKV